MACSAVEDVRVGYVFAVVCDSGLATGKVHGMKEALTNEDCPEVDESEKGNISELLKREDEWKDVVRYTLRESIHGVEGVAGVRCRHNPLVMRFVQRFVNRGMVQTPVNPVDAQICKDNEQRKLKEVVESKWSI